MRIKGPGLSVLIILIFVMNLCFSCSTDSCMEETTSFLNATFYKKGSTSISLPDSVTVFGIGKETTKLYNKALKVSTIKLPLDASTETCGFVIKINDKTDTLRFTYSVYPYLISKECGITFFYTLNSYSTANGSIDNIIIKNNNIRIFNEENIRIFY
jgi:hypothetical protein